MGHRSYGLGFISDDDIYQHVRDTVLRYRRLIDLDTFNANRIDPIKMLFDEKVYGRSIDEVIDGECFRQIDKSNANQIGFFHQNIFRYVNRGWEVPSHGFDVQNAKRHIFCEIKNKHNTMNSSSAQKTYIRMQERLLSDDRAVCYLVEVIARGSTDAPWKISVDGHFFNHDRIRRISIDRFYAMVFDDRLAFFRLCQVLPLILDDVTEDLLPDPVRNTVREELALNYSDDLHNALMLMAFKDYEGFSCDAF